MTSYNSGMLVVHWERRRGTYVSISEAMSRSVSPRGTLPRCARASAHCVTAEVVRNSSSGSSLEKIHRVLAGKELFDKGLLESLHRCIPKIFSIRKYKQDDDLREIEICGGWNDLLDRCPGAR